MAKEVTCHITGEKGPKEEFVKIGRYYYKSQEIYDAMVENRNKINEAKGIIAKDFLGYAKGQKYPTALISIENEKFFVTILEFLLI